MKGYGGRESPKPTGPVEVGPGYATLSDAMSQIDIADRLGRKWKRRMVRVDPMRAGVNFISYAEDGSVLALVEIGTLRYKIEEQDTHLYPALPILQIPPQILVGAGYKVILAIGFLECVAWTRLYVKSEGGQPISDVLPLWRIGTPHGAHCPMPVVEIKTSELKIIPMAELE